MPWLIKLAEVARRTGFPVVESPGWKTRGHGPQPAVKGVVCHHTAGRNDMHVVRDGRPGLDGPLSHFWLKHDGTIHVIAAGRCWHNAPSTSAYHSNSNSIGIEAENNGREPWPDVQLRAFKALCAELCKEYRLTAARVKGHKEVNRSKPDPHTISMTAFRMDVAELMAGDELQMNRDQVFDAVWNNDRMPVPWGTKDNPNWMPKSILVDMGELLRELHDKVDKLTAEVNTLKEVNKA